jgi:hypothetical protein
MNRTALRTALAAVVALSLVAAAPAHAAQPAHQGSPGELSGWLVLGAGYGYGSGYHNGFGVGGRYRTGLVPEGLIQGRGTVRDSLDLEFGADLVRYAYGYRNAGFDYDYVWWAFRPRAGLLWNFWLTPQLALYPKLDLGYEFGWFDGWNSAAGPRPGYAGVFLEPSIGLIYRTRSATSVRVELGSEGLKLGLGVAF